MADAQPLDSLNGNSTESVSSGDRRYGGLTSLQLNFIIVAGLFGIVVLLGLINLMIHMKESNKRKKENIMAHLGDSGRISRGGGGGGGKKTRAMLLF